MIQSRLKALLVLLTVAAPALANFPSAAGLARDTAPASQYDFDLNAGAELQAQTSEKSAPELEFTTDGGVPYSMPYDYQRIGSDGESCRDGAVVINTGSHATHIAQALCCCRM